MNKSTLPFIWTGEQPSSLAPGSVVQQLEIRKEAILEKVSTIGAVVIPGLKLETADDFRAVCASICSDLKNYTGGDSPRTGVADQVYTSTEYDAKLEVLLHNELSYAGWSPEFVFFGCLIPSETGGATQVADGREIYKRLNPDVRNRFESSGVTYLQHLWDANGQSGPGKSWQETFETDSRKQAEKYLEISNMQFQWTDLGLKTAATKPAVRIHQTTGEKCWHNQADQWHRDMISVKDSVGAEADTRSSEESGKGQNQLGNHVCYGDGSEIDITDLYHIREVAQSCEVVRPWQQGDILILDNVLTQHGRKPFTGPRKVLVAMA